jgi:hypothetical protein
VGATHGRSPVPDARYTFHVCNVDRSSVLGGGFASYGKRPISDNQPLPYYNSVDDIEQTALVIDVVGIDQMLEVLGRYWGVPRDLNSYASIS